MRRFSTRPRVGFVAPRVVAGVVAGMLVASSLAACAGPGSDVNTANTEPTDVSTDVSGRRPR